jgi:hypothetical protein
MKVEVPFKPVECDGASEIEKKIHFVLFREKKPNSFFFTFNNLFNVPACHSLKK